MKKMILIPCLLPLVACEDFDLTPKCWDESVKEIVISLGKDVKNEKIIDIKNIYETGLSLTEKPGTRSCEAELVTEYNDQEGTYSYYNVRYDVNLLQKEDGSSYIRVSHMMPIQDKHGK